MEDQPSSRFFLRKNLDLRTIKSYVWFLTNHMGPKFLLSSLPLYLGS